MIHAAIQFCVVERGSYYGDKNFVQLGPFEMSWVLDFQKTGWSF